MFLKNWTGHKLKKVAFSWGYNLSWGVFHGEVTTAALKWRQTLSKLTLQYRLLVSRIAQWKQRLMSSASELFQDGRVKKQPREAIRCVEL